MRLQPASILDLLLGHGEPLRVWLAAALTWQHNHRQWLYGAAQRPPVQASSPRFTVDPLYVNLRCEPPRLIWVDYVFRLGEARRATSSFEHVKTGYHATTLLRLARRHAAVLGVDRWELLGNQAVHPDYPAVDLQLQADPQAVLLLLQAQTNLYRYHP